MESNIDPTIGDSDLFNLHEKHNAVDSVDAHDNGGESKVGGVDESESNVMRLSEYVNGDDNGDTNGDIDSATTSAALKIMNMSNFDFQHDEMGNPYVEYSDDDKAAGGAVKLVQYNPGEKPKRLGRPRKHIVNKLTPPESTSSQNYNEAVLSKFRLDSQPVEGPGSRGGKQAPRPVPKGRITSDRAAKRKRQSSLPFEPEDSQKNDDDKPPAKKVPKKQVVLKLTLKQGQQAKKPIKKKPTKKVPGTKPLRALPTSRTTVFRVKNKVTRLLPGPLVGVFYDYYDENVMNLKAMAEDSPEAEIKNAEEYKLRIAAGYPKVKKAPYAGDILYIIAFLQKFRDVVRIYGIGPQTIEKGLSLPSETNGDDYDPNYISDEMSRLFKRLLTLVLNRKKEVVSHASAIGELKPMTHFLGLPKEWREDVVEEPVELEAPQSPVDPSVPEILLTKDSYYKEHTRVVYNPFYNPEFESGGLAGMPNPEDRLVLLRALVQWCLTSSDIIKNYITLLLQLQDLPGDRETIYGAITVMKGNKATEEAKKEAETRLSKRKSEEDAKYVDPTSDPLSHCLKIRLMEELVGDAGYKIGRFYLCRMADETNGGLTTMKRMNALFNDPTKKTPYVPSEFKLYVQDVHGMLVEGFTTDGLEFDGEGNEVKQESVTGEHWYEIAHNSESVGEFVQYLKAILGREKSPKKTIGATSKIYLPLTNLLNYLESILPLLIHQESIERTERNLRRRLIDYNDRKFDDFIDENDEANQHLEGGADDDYDDAEDMEPVEDDEDYEYED
jgi:hypothetical protein